MDKHMCIFKGMRKNKQYIKYKREEDGFRDGFLSEKYLTYVLYPRNESDAKKHQDRSAPFHSRVIALFGNFKGLFHDCVIDDL